MEFDKDTLISAGVFSSLNRHGVDLSEVRLTGLQRELILAKFVCVKADAYVELTLSPEYQVGVMIVQSSKTPWGLISLLVDLVRFRRKVRMGRG